jgi:bifunctional UDP-N-acetylglucosamine pyrophosphorylase/glucosamine-1-phosphate N-acetyltransferase
VIILAAGRGTRMRSERAKVLHGVVGTPFIVSVLDTALALLPTRVAVVVGHEAERVRQVCVDHLARRHATVPVVFPVQRRQRGTGDATRTALPHFEGFTGDLLILYGDVPGLRTATLEALVGQHRRAGATLSLLTATFENPAGYGRIRRGAGGGLEAIVEERDLGPDERGIREINPGIYCVAGEFLATALARLRDDNAQREYYLTDIVATAVAAGVGVSTLAVTDRDEVAGINSRQEMAIMEERVRRALVERWMQAGVTFRDPATVYLEPEVTIGADTEIGPNVQLLGATSVGRDCRIDGTAQLRDARVGDRVHLRFGVVMNECEVGDGAVIGPFAHLRPGTVLAPDVHLGNFVETKNARLGTGTKANHLSYLGDAEIGERTNVGAGTITCNYDGFAKHRTVIGSRVQIGSDTQLVAPVTVGDDAYVGAGTTVTRDVGAGELAVSRVAQRNVPGWVARRRARAAAGPAAVPPSTSSAKARPNRPRAVAGPSPKTKIAGSIARRSAPPRARIKSGTREKR